MACDGKQAAFEGAVEAYEAAHGGIGKQPRGGVPVARHPTLLDELLAAVLEKRTYNSNRVYSNGE